MATQPTNPKTNNPVYEVESISSDELLRIFVDNTMDYAIILLDKNGKILSWNKTAEHLKGWKSNEIVGQYFTCFYPPEDINRGKPEMELKEAQKKGRFEDEGWRVKKDGTRFWANVVLTPIYNKDKELIGFGKITRDFTHRKEAEEKIRKQAQEILEMATVPIVQVWNGIVMAPLIGTLDSIRTQQLMERLLERITSSNSSVAVIDITGVSTVDTQTAQHLIETISAVRLLGSEVVLTGVGPVIAQTLVHLSIDLSNVITCSSLASGLRKAFEIIDHKVIENVETP